MSTPGEAGCWVIEHDARAIGFVNFRDYKPKAKSAEIGIGIGEPGLWGKRLGREALDLEVRYLREHLGLHRIGLSVVSHNDRAIWMYKAAGFVVEGIERDGIGRDEGFVDSSPSPSCERPTACWSAQRVTRTSTRPTAHSRSATRCMERARGGHP